MEDFVLCVEQFVSTLDVEVEVEEVEEVEGEDERVG